MAELISERWKKRREKEHDPKPLKSLVKEIADGAEASQGLTSRVIDSLLNQVQKELRKGNAVTLPGIGIVTLRHRASRKYRFGDEVPAAKVYSLIGEREAA